MCSEARENDEWKITQHSALSGKALLVVIHWMKNRKRKRSSFWKRDSFSLVLLVLKCLETELEQVLARCSPWVNAPQGSWRWSSLGWGQSLRSPVPVSTLTGRPGLGGVLRGLKLWFLLVLPTSELTLVISWLFGRTSSTSKWISFLYSPAF